MIQRTVIMALTFDNGDHGGRDNGQGIGLLPNRTRVLVPAPFSHYKQTGRPEGQWRRDRQEVVLPKPIGRKLPAGLAMIGLGLYCKLQRGRRTSQYHLQCTHSLGDNRARGMGDGSVVKLSLCEFGTWLSPCCYLIP